VVGLVERPHPQLPVVAAAPSWLAHAAVTRAGSGWPRAAAEYHEVSLDPRGC
jgi:hypothetical protein